MIPKVIHYCWFGEKEKPKDVLKCIASWKKFCPNYKIVEWNESNYNVQENDYLKYCYDNKKWAFLSDYVRLAIVCKYGGIYFDTDVELVKNPDELLNYEAFYGFETDEFVATGLGFGAMPEHTTIKSMLLEYDVLMKKGRENYTVQSCPQLNTKALIKHGLITNGKKQMVGGAIILPIEYLNPYDDPTGVLKRTENTIAIHWYSKSWLDRKTVLKSKLTQPFHRAFGKDCFKWLKNGKI